MKKILAFDMDDTLCAFVSAVIQLARRELGVSLKIPMDSHNYKSWFGDQLTEQQRDELKRLVRNEQFYESLSPAMSTHVGQPSIEELSEVAWNYYDAVMIITARSGNMGTVERGVEVTREWLRKNSFKHVDHVDIIVHGHETPKIHYLMEREKKDGAACVMVDDSTVVADGITAHGGRSSMLLVEQPWNLSYAGSSKVKRVKAVSLKSAIIGAVA